MNTYKKQWYPKQKQQGQSEASMVISDQNFWYQVRPSIVKHSLLLE